MDDAQHIRILQYTYAAQLADSVSRYAGAGILDQVTTERRSARLANGAAQAAQLGVSTPGEAFTVSARLFGCADWTVEEDGGGALVATAGRCLLCSLAKKAGAPSPCRLFCLDPLEGLVQGVRPGAGFDVLETLYDGERCRVRVG
jgi:hypothetical protein